MVENTFNAIWLRDHINCSTNFGSHLSDAQAQKIIDAPRVETIIFLWDEGAETRAEKAIEKIRKFRGGKNLAACYMKGQPDDHSLETLKKWASATVEAAERRITEYDAR